MADSQKKNSSVNVKEKDPLQDLDIGNDLFSWKSISMAEGDELDFDLTPVSKGNKKTFNFDKADMDFNLDADFGKISSFNLDMPDLDMSPPLKRDARSKEKSKESSNGKDKGKIDQFAFGFDFDELENFSFDSSTKTQRDKNKIGSSPNESACQDKEASTHINESKSSLKDGPQKPSITESRITFDMDCLVGVADLETTKEIYPSNSATDDGVTTEHSAAIDVGASDKAKGPLETTISRELPNISPSKSGGNSPAAEKNVNSMDKNAYSNVEQDASMTLAVGSTCNYKHTSGNSQHLQAVAISENIIEPSGGNSLTAESYVSCMDTDVSGLNGEQDATMKLAAGSTSIYEHTSKNSEHVQAVAISENISGGRTRDETEDHMEDDRRNERGQNDSHIENICTTGAVSGIPSDKDSQEPALEILKCPFISQTADPTEKQTDNIKEPPINCSLPLRQLEKPECPVLKVPTQAMSSLSSEQTGFAQPVLAEGRARDATQRDRKLFSLSLQCSKTLLRGNIPQIQSHESCNSLKTNGEAPIADRNKLNDSGTAQVKDTGKAECGPRQRERCMKDLDILSMDTNRKTAESSGNPKKLASVSVNKITPAKEHRAWSIEGSRKPPDLPGLKLSRLSIDSTKSPIRKESKSIETSNQKTVSFRKSPTVMAHPPETRKQITSVLSMKRALEDAAADTLALHPSKRLSQPAAASRSFVEASAKVLDKKVPSHNRIENERIKSAAGNCQVTLSDIPNQAKTKGVEILSSTRNESNIELANDCSKELVDLCDILRKKHDEAKELLVRAIVNSNKLLLLNNPQLEEKIRATQNLFAGLTINSIHG